MSQPWEIEKFLEVKNNQLYIDGVSAVELAKEHGTPLFVYSENRIRHNIARIKRAESLIGCPLKICYAAKAMSTMGILKAVKNAGCDIEVNSGGELWKALEIGFRGEQIIFNGTSKEIWEIEAAINAEIYAIQVDSLYELSLIEETAIRLGKRANVSLRLVPEIQSDTHSGLQTALRTSKFGMMPDEALAAFHKYKNSPNLNLAGIHLHIGSQNPSPIGYAEAFQILFDNLIKIFEETNVRLSHINLGGGFPVSYLRDGTIEPSFAPEQRDLFSADFDPAEAIKIAWETVKKAAEENKTSAFLENITLLLEPGRSIIADTGICLTTVRNAKQRPVYHHKGANLKPGDTREEFGFVDADLGILCQFPKLESETWLLTDAGFNVLLSMETYKWYYHLISASRGEEPAVHPYKLAGPLCDGGDVYFDIEGQGRLPDHRPLPKNVRVGEILALLNCGAYSLAQASQYNGRFLPAVVLIKDRAAPELIRRRDRFEDLVGSDIF
ncbi:MAG: diaminopimelate decarboxylase [Acidobacteria bacterium]|nr:diaminopimelate decarboxylase [Acidobacteriota bacterium]